MAARHDIHVFLDSLRYNRILRLAMKRGVSVARIHRDAIDLFLDKYDPLDPNAPGPPPLAEQGPQNPQPTGIIFAIPKGEIDEENQYAKIAVTHYDKIDKSPASILGLSDINKEKK